jgi:hypothetical protein
MMDTQLTSNGSAASPNGETVATIEESDSPLSPPYWRTHFADESSASVERRHLHSQIQLEDHTEEDSEQFGWLWAKAVRIDDYTIVRGGAPAIGAYVVWNCTVDILDVSSSNYIKVALLTPKECGVMTCMCSWILPSLFTCLSFRFVLTLYRAVPSKFVKGTFISLRPIQKCSNTP